MSQNQWHVFLLDCPCYCPRSSMSRVQIFNQVLVYAHVPQNINSLFSVCRGSWCVTARSGTIGRVQQWSSVPVAMNNGSSQWETHQNGGKYTFSFERVPLTFFALAVDRPRLKPSPTHLDSANSQIAVIGTQQLQACSPRSASELENNIRPVPNRKVPCWLGGKGQENKREVRWKGTAVLSE